MRRRLFYRRGPIRCLTISGDCTMRTLSWMFPLCLALLITAPASADEPKGKLTGYFPPPEAKGGWRSLLPDKGEPSADQKAQIKKSAGIDWDKLASAWELNSKTDGSSGLLVIRRGQIAGEWYKDGDRD